MQSPTYPVYWDATPSARGASFASPGTGFHQSADAATFNTTASSRPAFSRGAPPKPRQSGYSLWVGNLPDDVSIFDLKDYFSREASDQIESVFLIFRSNCAFVNYKTKLACVEALSRFHESIFPGARIALRSRRTSGSVGFETADTQMQFARRDMVDGEPGALAEGGAMQMPLRTLEATGSRDRFFILKSLTLDDLELSTFNGIWATQAHNEVILDDAYKSAQNVYLIFSANRSGEFFGYARMASGMQDEPAVTATPTEAGTDGRPAEQPNFIATPAGEFAPKGRIFHDPVRGTIFWEINPDSSSRRDEAGGDGDGVGGDDGVADVVGGAVDSRVRRASSSRTPAAAKAAAAGQHLGRPFSVQWLCVRKLAFGKTRGLKNPWNATREVKVARDGTELEPDVGRRLIALFNIR